MNECWNFFRYASKDEIEEIISLAKKNKVQFSHLKKSHFLDKIEKKECIYENGVLITFRIVNFKTKLGSYTVNIGNTILEQIIKNQEKSNSNLVKHVFLKFINCAPGAVYLAVNKRNLRAIKFYSNMNMKRISETILDYKDDDDTYVKGYIFKTNTINLKIN